MLKWFCFSIFWANVTIFLWLLPNSYRMEKYQMEHNDGLINIIENSLLFLLHLLWRLQCYIFSLLSLIQKYYGHLFFVVTEMFSKYKSKAWAQPKTPSVNVDNVDTRLFFICSAIFVEIQHKFNICKQRPKPIILVLSSVERFPLIWCFFRVFAKVVSANHGLAPHIDRSHGFWTLWTFDFFNKFSVSNVG